MEDKKKIKNESDLSYKSFLTEKESFLELLRSFVKEEWVKMLDEEDLELVNKSFILSDYEERESDIIYKLKLKEKEIYFYILLELQSTVDFTMPFRLLVYITELWKQIFINTEKNERESKKYKLPSIVPLVLYNGENNWTAKRSFKEMQAGNELFGDHLVDFNYLLVDVNRYDDEELIEMGNLISTIFLLDKKSDRDKFVDRFTRSINSIKKMTPTQVERFKKWLRVIIFPKLPKQMNEELMGVIENIEIKGGEEMVSNISIMLDEIREEGIELGIETGMQTGMQKGIEKEKYIIVRNMIRLGVDVALISESTGVSISELEKIKRELEN